MKKKFRQYINGKFISFLEIEASKDDIETLENLLFFPKKGERVEEYVLYRLTYSDRNNRVGMIKFITSSFSGNFFQILKGKVYNGIKVENLIKESFKRKKVKNFLKQGRQFEKLVSNYYRNNKYKVINNFEKNEEDEGIDIIAMRDNELCLIQCKNWNIHLITVKELKEFLGSCYFFLWKYPKYRKFRKKHKIFAVSRTTELSKNVYLFLKEAKGFLELKKF